MNMKKLLPFFAFLFVLLLCVSCSSANTPAGEEVTESTESTSSGAEVIAPGEKDEMDTIEVYPMGKDKIPVDRQKVVDYMHEMGSVTWTPNETATYTQTENWNIDLTYEAGTVYHGMLYSFTICSLEHFRDSVDDSGVYTGSMIWNKSVGNDCTTSVMAAWQTVSPSTHFQDTAEMFSNSGKGTIPVGDYNWEDFTSDSSQVTAKTSADKMYAIYQTLQPGDVLLNRWETAGHCRMIDAEPILVYKGTTDKINPSRCLLSVSEQCSSWNNHADYPTTWKLNQEYSFEQLYKGSYIPLTCTELATGLADAPVFRIEDRYPATKLAYKGRITGKVTCNYRMTSVTVSIKNAEEETIFTATLYPTDRECSLSQLNSKANIFGLPAGAYSLVVEAAIGPGSFVIDEQHFVKE